MKVIHAREEQQDDKKRVSDNTRLLDVGLLSILAAGLLFSMGVLAVYFFYFHGPISNHHEVWASFGNYLSGTLGPLFAFLTFIGLLFTISIQARQVSLSNETLRATQQELKLAREATDLQAHQFREEMTKSELSDMFKFVHLEFERRFDKKVDFSRSGENLGFYFSNSAPSAGSAEIPKNGDPVSGNDRVLLADLCELMMELNGYLAQYEAQFEASALTFFYKKRYSTCARRLTENGFLIKEALSAFQSIGYGWSAPAKPIP